jgi:tRNA pseudouridine38-40 synthase
MRVALKFAYHGKEFSGYARQPGQRTIEQTLLTLLTDQEMIMDARTSCFRTASRTDRGVSALGNVCAFDTTYPSDRMLPRLSKSTSELFIYGIKVVAADFYPRHAVRREYRYYLRNHGLDVDRILYAASLFTGEHNFQNFARVEPLKNPIRSIDAMVVSEKKDFLIFDFYAQTFLWNQIRRIVSALQQVGEGTLSAHAIMQALHHPGQKVDFQVAAPEPLILSDVLYGFSFECLKGYATTLKMFEKRIVASLE